MSLRPICLISLLFLYSARLAVLSRLVLLERMFVLKRLLKFRRLLTLEGLLMSESLQPKRSKRTYPPLVRGSECSLIFKALNYVNSLGSLKLTKGSS